MNERIKALRKALDLTQQEFADKMKVKRNTVATYELGRSVPSDSAIALICREFDVNETWLRTGEGEMFVKLTRDEELADFVGDILISEKEDFRHRFISALSRLDVNEWKLLEKITIELAKEFEQRDK